jgi:hypothetical protein
MQFGVRRNAAERREVAGPPTRRAYRPERRRFYFLLATPDAEAAEAMTLPRGGCLPQPGQCGQIDSPCNHGQTYLSPPSSHLFFHRRLGVTGRSIPTLTAGCDKISSHVILHTSLLPSLRLACEADRA